MPELIDAREVLGIPKAGTDFIGTTRELYGWRPAAHHLIIAQALVKLANREIKDNRLLIIAPPGHAKTNWGGIAFPTWYIAHHQYEHILSFSATGTLSRKSSTTIRDTIANSMRWKGLYPHIVPDFDKGWSQNAWVIKRPMAPGDKDPTMFSTSVGSQAVLGGRGDGLIFDDVSTQKNVSTASQRQAVKDWVGQTAFSRATPDAWMLGIMTRWHSDDIAAFLEREGFTVIVLPANGYWESPDDYLKADINGPALWPSHINEEMLLKQRRAMGDFRYTAMYQGNPVAVEGAVFQESHFGPWSLPMTSQLGIETLRKFRRAVLPPYNAVPVHDVAVGEPRAVPLTYKALFVDTALKSGEQNDYTEFALWGVGIDRQAYLLAEWHEHADAADLFDEFIMFWKEHQPDVAVIEDKGSGIQLIQDIQRKTRVPVSTVLPATSKEDRARAQVHVIKGAFHIPDPAHPEAPAWVAEWLTEHLEFPRGVHDDRVDTTSMAAEFLKYMLDFFEQDADGFISALPAQAGHGGRERTDAWAAGGAAGDEEQDGESMFGGAPGRADMGVW